MVLGIMLGTMLVHLLMLGIQLLQLIMEIIPFHVL